METYLATAVVLALTPLLGAGLCSIGHDGGWDWLAPAVGLSAAMLTAWLTIRLPGAATTAALFLAAAAVASAVALGRGGVPWRQAATGVPVALLVGAVCALPFLANERIGVLGESLNDDIAFHMDWAYALAQGGDATERVRDDYPVGPHALAGSVAEALGTTAEPAFMGLVLALPIVTALCALAALEAAPPPARVLGASLVGISYLVAGVLVQSSFKELVLGTLVLAFAVVARRFLRGEISPRRGLAISAALAGAACTTYSFPALAWFIAGGAVAVALHLLVTRRRSGLRAVVLAGAGIACFAVVAMLLLRLAGFFEDEGPGRYAFSQGRTGAVGNLLEHLSPFQALSVWPSDDFRAEPEGDWWRLGVAVGALAVAAGLVRAAMRRELGLLGVAVAAAGVYGLAVALTNPYNSAKALAIAGPVLTATALAGLLAGAGRSGPRRAGPGGPRRLAPVVLAVVWGALALHSTVTLLRAAPVRPQGQSTQLDRVAEAVAGKGVAFLGHDSFAQWELRRAAFVITGGTVDLSGKPGAPRPSPVPSLAGWIVSPRTRYAPSPGPELRRTRRTRWYEVLRRTAPNTTVYVAREGTAPGAILSCADRRTRALAKRRWRALAKPQPVLGAGGSWYDPSGRRPFATETFTFLGLERTLRQDLALPPGRWELSLRYYSADPLTVTAGGLTETMPAYLADRTRFWRVGSVTSAGGPIAVTVRGGESRPVQPRRNAELFDVAAVREDRPGRLVPLRRACGRYVDFLTPPRRG